MKSKQKVIEAVRERCHIRLVEAMERGVQGWPLPPPPRSHPEVPVKEPDSADSIIDQAYSLFMADRGSFTQNLNETVELIVPHRMSLTENPFEQHEKWLLRRLDLVAERILFSTCTSWLAQALDEQVPDTERWWLAFTLLDGLCIKHHGQSVHQGYHLLESIALAQRPGTWHTQPESGPHQMTWDPQAAIPRTSLVADEDGSISARHLLKRLEEGGEDRRLLLIEWIRLLLERKELFVPLNISSIVLRRASDPSQRVAAALVGCLARLMEVDGEVGRQMLVRLDERGEEQVERALADVLTRLFRRIEWDAVPYLEKMLQSEDENILAAASATVGDLRFLDEDLFAETLRVLVDHEVAIVRRNLVPHLREYIRMFPDDHRGVLSTLWVDGDEVVATRLRELLMRLEEVDPTSFSMLLHRLKGESPAALERLWSVLIIRKAERVEGWKAYLEEGAEAPAVTPPKQENRGPSSNMEVELPSLANALSKLDGEE